MKVVISIRLIKPGGEIVPLCDKAADAPLSLSARTIAQRADTVARYGLEMLLAHEAVVDRHHAKVSKSKLP